MNPSFQLSCSLVFCPAFLCSCSDVGQVLDQVLTESVGVPRGSLYKALDKYNFTGNYEGEDNDGGGHFSWLVLERLEINKQGGTYSIEGFMNAINFEEGMSRPSNTRYSWSGTGMVEGEFLNFRTQDGSEKGRVFKDAKGKQVLVFEGNTFMLTRLQ